MWKIQNKLYGGNSISSNDNEDVFTKGSDSSGP